MSSKTVFSLDELKAHLAITTDKLDQECVNQPVLYQEVSQLTAQAMHLFVEAKDNLETVSARVASAYRQAALDSGEKTTESKIEEHTIGNVDVIGAKALLRDAQLSYDSCNGLRRSYEHRLDMLKTYSQLINGSYRQFV